MQSHTDRMVQLMNRLSSVSASTRGHRNRLNRQRMFAVAFIDRPIAVNLLHIGCEEIDTARRGRHAMYKISTLTVSA